MVEDLQDTCFQSGSYSLVFVGNVFLYLILHLKMNRARLISSNYGECFSVLKFPSQEERNTPHQLSHEMVSTNVS